jgi:alkaline phosphatase D
MVLVFFSCDKKDYYKAPVKNKQHKLAIMQSATTETETLFVVLAPKHEKIDFSILDSKSNKLSKENIKIQTHSMFDSKWLLYHIKALNLKLNESYQLRALSASGKWNDLRSFKTLATKSKTALNLSVMSCSSDVYNEVGNVIWPKVVASNTDIHLMIGDNVYADVYHGVYLGLSATNKHLWNRYIETRNKLAIFRSEKLTPTYAIWDDHDYGENDGDENYKYKDDSKKIFELFFPHRLSSQVQKGPGISFSLTLRGQKFIFFDNRSFRSESKDGFHFGQIQNQWLDSQLQASPEKFIYLVNGDQYFGAYHPFESFEGDHPKKFKGFLDKLKNKTSKKFVFLSGDRHMFELMKIDQSILGYETYEVTSSGIHAIVRFGDNKPPHANKRRIKVVDGEYHFVNLRSEVSDQLIMSLEVIGVEKSLLSQKLSVK